MKYDPVGNAEHLRWTVFVLASVMAAICAFERFWILFAIYSIDAALMLLHRSGKP